MYGISSARRIRAGWLVRVQKAFMNAEIIAIGTELLLGVTVDTNSAYLARQLGEIGIPVMRVTLVGDELETMVKVIAEANVRSELVICSGGLGPTGDDLTREAIAQAVHRPLEFHQVLLDDISARFAAFKRTMSPSNRQQAYVPHGSYIMRNPRGTAPAFVAERNGHLVAALPGVPSELQWLTENALVPYLRAEHGANTVRVVREVRVSGLSEAAAGERIAEFFALSNPIVGITAKGGQHTIRLAASAASRDGAEALIAPLVAIIAERFGPHLLDTEKLEERVGRLLQEQGVSLLLYETLIQAPVFKLLQATLGGRSALERGGGLLQRMRGQPEQAGVEQIVQQLWQRGVGLGFGSTGMQALEDATSAEGSDAAFAEDQAIRLALAVIAAEVVPGAMTPVQLAITDGTSSDYVARDFDLNLASGYDILAVGAMELLRRRLEHYESAI